MILDITLKYMMVSIVISIIFGLTVLLSLLIKKRFKNEILNPYLFQLLSLCLFVIIWIKYKSNISILSTFNLLNWKNILLIFIAIVPASLIVYKGKKDKPNSAFENFLSGISMEIPQRLLVQNLFVILGVNSVIYMDLSLDIFLNSIIWIQFIAVQEIIYGRKITKKVAPEIFASFWFSIWVGILYRNSGNILLPMLSHGLQRILTYNIYSFKSIYQRKADI